MSLSIGKFNRRYKKTEVSTQHPYSFKEGFLKIDPSFSPHWKTTFSGNNLKFLLLDFSPSNNLHSIEDIIKLIELESRSSIASYPPALTQHIDIFNPSRNSSYIRNFLNDQEILSIYKDLSDHQKLKIEDDIIDRNNFLIHQFIFKNPTLELPFVMTLQSKNCIKSSATFHSKESLLNAFQEIIEKPILTTLKKHDFIF
jgi:hypothetical protein